MSPPLFKHQIESIERCRNSPLIFDGSDPGTGKTRVAIEVFAERRVRGGGCALIVCPKSLIRAAWAADFKKFAPYLKVSCAYARNRAEAFWERADIYITNHDAAKWLAKQKPDFFERFDTLIVDEVGAFKHATSQRSKALAKITRYFDFRHVMNGTPTPNSVTDLWHQMFLLDNGARLGASFFKFRSTVCVPRQVGPSANMLRWEDRPGANEAVSKLVEDIMIRHKFEDCIDIPPNHAYSVDYTLTPTQLKNYLQMEKAQLAVIKGQAVSAVNAAAVATKLLQIACIKYNTPVLSSRGWVPIQNIRKTDLIWDGEEWVSHEGTKLQGITTVIKRHGVWMTPEHLVLTEAGWRDGKSSEKFVRAAVRLPSSNSPCRDNKKYGNKMRHMGMLMRLREHSNSQEPVFTRKNTPSPTQLRMSARKQKARYVEHQTILQMVRYARPLLQPFIQRLQKLGRTGHNCMQTLAQQLRKFSFRYGGFVLAGAIVGENQQQQRIYTKKLPLGDGKTASQQHTLQYSYQDTSRHDDHQRSFENIQRPIRHITCSNSALQLDNKPRIEPVYDIINCGPRTRFVVQDENGAPLIVHNSGAVYDGEGNYHIVDYDRYGMVIDIAEQRQHTIVFFLWQHQKDLLVAEAQKRGLSYCVIDGSVNDTQRNENVEYFEKGMYRICFAHPQSAAHGLTLVKGTATIWASPTYNLEHYQQGLRRIYRAGQTQPTETITLVAENTIESRVWETLATKKLRMDDLLEQITYGVAK